MKDLQYGLHWFRRDLRVAGNPGLKWSWKQHQGNVVGVFFFDSKFLGRSDFSSNRFAFFLNTLKDLKDELRSIGSDLLVLDRGPLEGFNELFSHLKKDSLNLPKTCSFNRDYEPFARKRDVSIENYLKNDVGIKVHTERDHILIEPHEIQKENQSYYQVYTPYAKRWFEKLKLSETQNRITAQKEGLKYLQERFQGKVKPDLFRLNWIKVFGSNEKVPQDHLEAYILKNNKNVTVSIPNSGSVYAFKCLLEFKNRIDRYKEDRDFPSIEGTSKLSIFFKNGSLIPAQAIAALELESVPFKSESGKARFLKELVWREFYYQILYNYPRVETGAFIEKYNKIKWENREDFYEAWKQGRTGYPIVDAGMRQLNTTGWMHNRVRMIVASFLVKDLLITWQWGESYFMKMLLDGDLAPNNGGWQWAASTGCDPQPYFRIFNPVLQSKRFDPDGSYIRKYLPELKSRNSREIHVPVDPIIEHSSRKLKALSLFSVS
jgi:deoxyribodipyrimidine photo-lyase